MPRQFNQGDRVFYQVAQNMVEATIVRKLEGSLLRRSRPHEDTVDALRTPVECCLSSDEEEMGGQVIHTRFGLDEMLPDCEFQ